MQRAAAVVGMTRHGWLAGAVAAALALGCADDGEPDPDGDPGSDQADDDDDISDRDAARVSGLDEVCAPGAGDDVCGALRRAEQGGGGAGAALAEARDRLAARVAADRDASLRDPALHYYLRERAVGLFIRQLGGAPAADDVLAEHYPSDDASTFAIARIDLAPPAVIPADRCPRREAVVFSPGLFRGVGEQEMSEVFDAMAEAFPCLDTIRVDNTNFASLAVTAEEYHQATTQIAADVPLHLLGHSAGAATVIHALGLHPDLAARARTVISLQPVARGTEAADGLLSIFPLAGDAIGSMTVPAADAFWAEHGDDLPQTALYVTLRAFITRKKQNLPLSMVLLFKHLREAGGDHPQNDMQVLLTRQRLGGPVADIEVLSRVAEGNHYQWGLSAEDVPDVIMPDSMSDRIPRGEFFTAWYQALHEVGLVLPP